MQTFEEFYKEVDQYNFDIKHSYDKLKNNFNCANGCGSKGGIDFPDSLWWCSIESACNNHDIDWKLAKNYNELVEANHRFRKNMEKIIDFESKDWFFLLIRLKTMSRYYRMVKLIGTKSYAKERGFIIEH